MDRIEYLVNDLRNLEKAAHEFAKQNGFWPARPQDFKDCLLISWKLRKRKDKDFIDYERINQKVDIAHQIFEKYDIYDEKHPLLDFRLMLFKAGIYSFYDWYHEKWAIPNHNKEMQDFLLPLLPTWAEVKHK